MRFTGGMTMKRKSSALNYIKYWHMRERDNAKDKWTKEKHQRLYKKAQEAEDEFNEMITDAQMQGLRNPAFPGDLVGWLDDDFSLPEDYWGGKQNNDEDGEEKK
jgi:hypothetical protein